MPFWIRCCRPYHDEEINLFASTVKRVNAMKNVFELDYYYYIFCIFNIQYRYVRRNSVFCHTFHHWRTRLTVCCSKIAVSRQC